MNKPKIVCICGSSRFVDHHAIARWELESKGVICLMINYLPQWYVEKQGWGVNDHFAEHTGVKKELDVLHFRKIDLSDEILVINIDNYIGEFTRNEINYAIEIGKPVKYYQPPEESQE